MGFQNLLRAKKRKSVKEILWRINIVFPFLCSASVSYICFAVFWTFKIIMPARELHCKAEIQTKGLYDTCVKIT